MNPNKKKKIAIKRGPWNFQQICSGSKNSETKQFFFPLSPYTPKKQKISKNQFFTPPYSSHPKNLDPLTDRVDTLIMQCWLVSQEMVKMPHCLTHVCFCNKISPIYHSFTILFMPYWTHLISTQSWLDSDQSLLAVLAAQRDRNSQTDRNSIILLCAISRCSLKNAAQRSVVWSVECVFKQWVYFHF